MAKHVLNTRTNKKHDLYFVLASSVSLVKIGITSDFETRFRTLQAGSPVPLEAWLVIKATARRELALHVHFAEERRHSEWFALSERMRALVDEIRGIPEREISKFLSRFDLTASSWTNEKRERFRASHAARRTETRRPVLHDWQIKAARDTQRARAQRLFAGIELALIAQGVAA